MMPRYHFETRRQFGPTLETMRLPDLGAESRRRRQRQRRLRLTVAGLAMALAGCAVTAVAAVM